MSTNIGEKGNPINGDVGVLVVGEWRNEKDKKGRSTFQNGILRIFLMEEYLTSTTVFLKYISFGIKIMVI